MQEIIIPAKNLKLESEKVDFGPSAQQMKDFAAKFTKIQWDKLCSIRGFYAALSNSIEEADKIAKEAKL